MAPPLDPLISALGRSTKGCTPRSLAERLDQPPRDVRRKLELLQRRGLAAPKKRGLYCLTDAGREALRACEKPSKPKTWGYTPQQLRHSQRARAWRAMRMLRKFTVHDLVVNAARPEERGAYSNISGFIKWLAAAGFLVRLPREGRRFRWILVRDTGPYPPSCNHIDKRVTDKNTGVVYEL